MKYLFPILWFTSFYAYSQQVQIADPLSDPIQSAKAWSIETIEWDTIFQDGSRLAILEGPRNIPGKAFSYAFYLPDGVWVTPHWHCADARVFIAQGKLLLGYGENFDKKNTQIFETGSYLLVPYKETHFEGAKGNTIIIGTGVGPWCTYEINE